jgi:hypothetical protein
VTSCTPEGALLVGAPARQQEIDPLAPKERNGIGGWLTSSNGLSRRWWSTARLGGAPGGFARPGQP